MQFDFGRNWEAFSQRALTESHVSQAHDDFARLLDGIELTGRSFLDIGFGQGLSLLTAATLGARVVGCDISPTCAQVLRRNARYFPNVATQTIPLVVGSIMQPETQVKLRSWADEGFDIVHSWGVLHHTGNMMRAIRVAASLVAPRGYLVISIYNRHWSSPVWRWIKRLYCRLPGLGQRLMVAVLYPVIWLAKLVVTRQNPRLQERGMDFYYDVVDWVGGYPYEYATADQLLALADELGFSCTRHRPPRVPTGCNEFVFRRLA